MLCGVATSVAEQGYILRVKSTRCTAWRNGTPGFEENWGRLTASKGEISGASANPLTRDPLRHQCRLRCIWMPMQLGFFGSHAPYAAYSGTTRHSRSLAGNDRYRKQLPSRVFRALRHWFGQVFHISSNCTPIWNASFRWINQGPAHRQRITVLWCTANRIHRSLRRSQTCFCEHLERKSIWAYSPLEPFLKKGKR